MLLLCSVCRLTDCVPDKLRGGVPERLTSLRTVNAVEPDTDRFVRIVQNVNGVTVNDLAQRGCEVGRRFFSRNELFCQSIRINGAGLLTTGKYDDPDCD